MKLVMRIRRRFAAVAVLLGFGLVALGAAQVNQSRSERITACERADLAARQWHRQLATELAPDQSGIWCDQAMKQPLAVLEAIAITGAVSR